MLDENDSTNESANSLREAKKTKKRKEREVRVLESSEEKERERERRRGAEFLRPRIAIVGREDSANRIPVSFTGENEQRATREVGERA